MFTGIVQEIGKVLEADQTFLKVRSSLLLGTLEQGDSVSVNGACLTVNSVDEDWFSVDTMPETIKRTNLGRLTVGSFVNLERALTLSTPLGGHIIQGHVDGVGGINSIIKDENAVLMEFSVPTNIIKYIVEKGFISVDGISLTVVGVTESAFSVSVVKYTLNNTTLGISEEGNPVNIEVDILAKYVEKLLPFAR
ncbi:MAG: riboflavin synthase [SAR202 cluster bacterium]|nr:riboflavin synthase [SAR202 cluster bacterium]|tara:strand:- start:4620 stop:5201 length:582 start_codon:yes stop_codon:yes gene_type:complete